MAQRTPHLIALVGRHSGRDLPGSSSPRPYLHPVRSLAGAVLTEVAPADHPHHLGLSIAFADLNGTNFWGGSTFTPDGPAVLPNHGRQVPTDWKDSPTGASPTAAAGTVVWRSEQGVDVAVERRSVRCYSHPQPGTWSLSVESVMVPAGNVGRLEVSSSAVKGRAGAGYGGIFWRFPAPRSQPLVLSANGEGAAAAHGSRSPWLAISTTVDGVPVSVVLGQGGSLRPWFVRTAGYLGAGPAVAWSEKAVAVAASPLAQSLHAVIHDGLVETPTQAVELLQHHPGIPALSPPDRTP
jgi:hypothetical protein